MSTQLQDIQENLFDFFQGVDNKLFVGFVDSFVYFQPAANDKVSKLIEKFLKENKIEDAYLKVAQDEKRAQAGEEIYLWRASSAERRFIEDVMKSLLSVSHNKFRRELNE